MTDVKNDSPIPDEFCVNGVAADELDWDVNHRAYSLNSAQVLVHALIVCHPQHYPS